MGSYACTTQSRGSQMLMGKLNAGCVLVDSDQLVYVVVHTDGTLGDGADAIPGGTWMLNGTVLTAKINWCVEGAPPNCLSQTDQFVCSPL